jgi:sulfur-carrier protein adenylyltransferase/sulfurtransferase
MFYWNPLYSVSISRSKIRFSDERGEFDLSLPPYLADWGVLNKLHHGVSPDVLNSATDAEIDLISALHRKNLIASLPTMDISYLDRNLGHILTLTSEPIKALERIRSSVVCILGLGGIGSVVLQHLAGIGVRNYIFVDSDNVEVSNLNRQYIFSQSDIGRPKTEASRDFVHTRISDAEISTHTIQIRSNESISNIPVSDCNIIINCMDTPVGHIDDIVHRFGQSKRVPVVGAAVGTRYGHWGPLICHHLTGISYSDWRRGCSLPASSPTRPRSEAPAPWSFGPSNTVIGSNLASDVIEWLAGHSSVKCLNTRLVHEFKTNQTTSYRKTPR